MKIICEN